MPTSFAPPRSSATSLTLANGTSRTSRSAPRSPDRRVPRPRAVDAPRARSGGGQIEEGKAEQDRRLAHVDRGVEAHFRVNGPIGDRHLAGRDEGRKAGEQADGHEDARHKLDDAGDPQIAADVLQSGLAARREARELD